MPAAAPRPRWLKPRYSRHCRTCFPVSRYRIVTSFLKIDTRPTGCQEGNFATRARQAVSLGYPIVGWVRRPAASNGPEANPVPRQRFERSDRKSCSPKKLKNASPAGDLRNAVPPACPGVCHEYSKSLENFICTPL
jgi:hypothetical protein